MVLPTMQENVINTIESLIEHFLWKGHKPKIPLQELQLNKESGGLGLVNLRIKDMSLKCSWVVLLQVNPCFASMIYCIYDIKLQDVIWKCNLDPHDAIEVFKDECFWSDVAKAWFGWKENHLKDPNIIWYNSEIKSGGAVLWWPKCYRKGLLYVSQLYHQGQLKSFVQLWNDFGLDCMMANAIISAVPSAIRQAFGKYRKTANIAAASSLQVQTRKVYKDQTTDVSALACKHRKWEGELTFEFPLQKLLDGLQDIYKVINIAKYRSFQYKLLHRAIITNVHLYHWKMNQTDRCTFCDRSRESYEHLFVRCKKVKDLWLEFENFVKIYSSEVIHFDVDTVLWNRLIIDKPSHIINFLCLIMKQYVYRQRCLKKPLIFEEYRTIIIQTNGIEKYIAKKNQKLYKHFRKWDPKKR